MQTYNILIIGSGGREYAIGLSLWQDSRVSGLYFAPGNAGTALLGNNITYTNNEELLAHCENLAINLVVVGPEEPLTRGVSDFLQAHKIKVFGPSAKAARLEGSKAFMKDFATRHKIPTARYLQSDNIEQIRAFIATLNPPIVVKADGLCAGKGVIIAPDSATALQEAQKMLSGESFGKAGKKVVIEEFLQGFELSVFALSNGKDCIILPPAQDHKRLLDNDEGVNTGGMGAYTPTPMCDENLFKRIKEEIMLPAIKGARYDDMEFCGVLFGGIMVVEQKGELQPYLLEFNVRFGDPECEVLLPTLKTPLLDILLCEDFSTLQVEFKDMYSCGVVVASKDYPYKSSIAQNIHIRPFDSNLGHLVFAGVSTGENLSSLPRDFTNPCGKDSLLPPQGSDSHLLASGGRVLLSVGLGKSLQEAQRNAYAILQNVDFSGMQYRKDIAHRGIAFLQSKN